VVSVLNATSGPVAQPWSVSKAREKKVLLVTSTRPQAQGVCLLPGLAGDVPSQDVEVVAVVEEVGVDRGLLEELRAYRREYGVLSRPKTTARPERRRGTWVLGADAQQLSSWRLLAQRTN
jgi:hypothetical protein